jgi:hypothetical protein
VHNSVNLYGSPADNLEYEVRFDNQDALTEALQCFVLLYVAYKGICYKVTEALIQFFTKETALAGLSFDIDGNLLLSTALSYYGTRCPLHH